MWLPEKDVSVEVKCKLPMALFLIVISLQSNENSLPRLDSRGNYTGGGPL